MNSNNQLIADNLPVTKIVDELTETIFPDLLQHTVDSDQPPSPSLSTTVADERTISVSDSLTGLVGDMVNVPISINNAAGLQSLTLTLTYDTNILDIPDPDPATDINEGVRRTGISANWKVTTGEGNNPDQEEPNPTANVNEQTGEVTISLINTDELPTEGGGDIIEIGFQIKSDANPGSLTNINLKTASLGINEQEISLGESSLDDNGIKVIGKGATVYRFLNNNAGVHFYTASEKEKDFIRDNLPQYTFEGASYSSALNDTDPLTGDEKPVYRFFNKITGVHLYTIFEREKDFIIDNLSETYNFEDVAYYAFESATDHTIPLYRFLNINLGTHFYTPSAKERDFVVENLPHYTQEGIGGVGFHIYEFTGN